jgi:hypothetical protein
LRNKQNYKSEIWSAWPGENRDNEIVSIPGLRGRDQRNFKKLVIIHARVVEIVEQFYRNQSLWTKTSQEIKVLYLLVVAHS